MSALSLPAAKAYLSIDTDTSDVEIQAVIDAAEAVLTERVGFLVPTTVTRRIRGGVSALALPDTPVVSLTSITPRTGTALTISDLYVDPVTGMVTYNNLGPFVAAYYTAVYSAGRATCPNDLLLAVKVLVKHLWEPKRGPGGAGARGTSTETSNRAPGYAYLLPFRVSELIAPHLQFGVG